MILKDSVNTKVPNVNQKLYNLIDFHANYELNLDNLKTFTNVIYAVEEQIKKENIDFSSLHKVNIFFTEFGNFSVLENIPNIFGSYLRVIVYKLGLINKVSDPRFKYFVFTEELVHHFWNTSDEKIVKYKTLDIMKLLGIDINIEDISKWGLNWE